MVHLLCIWLMLRGINPVSFVSPHLRRANGAEAHFATRVRGRAATTLGNSCEQKTLTLATSRAVL